MCFVKFSKALFQVSMRLKKQKHLALHFDFASTRLFFSLQEHSNFRSQIFISLFRKQTEKITKTFLSLFFFVLPSKRNFFHGFLIFQGRKFGTKMSSLDLEFFQLNCHLDSAARLLRIEVFVGLLLKLTSSTVLKRFF